MYILSFGKIYIVTVCHEDIYSPSTHILTLSYLRWKGLFNKQTQPWFFPMPNFFTCLPPEKLCDIAFIPSVLEHVQRCWVSWIRCIREVVMSCCHGSKTFGSQQTIVLQIRQNKMTCMTFPCMNLHSGRNQ